MTVCHARLTNWNTLQQYKAENKILTSRFAFMILSKQPMICVYCLWKGPGSLFWSVPRLTGIAIGFFLPKSATELAELGFSAGSPALAPPKEACRCEKEDGQRAEIAGVFFFVMFVDVLKQRSRRWVVSLYNNMVVARLRRLKPGFKAFSGVVLMMLCDWLIYTYSFFLKKNGNSLSFTVVSKMLAGASGSHCYQRWPQRRVQWKLGSERLRG